MHIKTRRTSSSLQLPPRPPQTKEILKRIQLRLEQISTEVVEVTTAIVDKGRFNLGRCWSWMNTNTISSKGAMNAAAATKPTI
ncbi:hypothetical protein PMIT1303_00200 [Prochlorococcus sp. MIT 1303]|nr:hypothetical protein PMIT1303_00200 [Prochlorococcus sp. MIT 1303]